MRSLILSIGMLLGSLSLTAQLPAAKNFNCNDCSAANHDLFTELNAGKVIVLCWVMPCSACEAPATAANNIVNNYATSHPGKVKFYLCDDYGNTSCSSLNSWATTLGLTNYTSFSNSAIKMSDYGSTGMPKIVVLSGGSSHVVYYNQNNSLSSTAFNNAIKNAIAGSAGVTYSVQPSKSITKTLVMNTASAAKISQFNTGSKKIGLSWEVLSINLPLSWQASMSDNIIEYPDIPTGVHVMDSVAPGDTGFLSLNVDPGTETGTGQLKALVYQDGFRVSADTLVWNFNTGSVGIQKNSGITDISVYPNPVRETLQINIPYSTVANVVITDMQGKTVRKSDLSEGKNSVDCASLAKGLYFVTVTTPDRRVVSRVTKE
jgi:hypothetical protein